MAILRPNLTIISLLLFAGLLLGASRSCLAADAVTKEYRLKAAFIYNFAKFVEWPRGNFANDSSPIVIGVLGANPFGDELGKTVHGRKISGRTIVIKAVSNAAAANGIDMLFVSGREVANFARLERSLGSGVLTVGESPQFARLGGMIIFNLEGDKLRFEINRGAATRGGLKISAQLQKLASAVRQ